MADWPDLARLKRELGVTQVLTDADLTQVIEAAIEQVIIDVGEDVESPSASLAEAAVLLAVIINGGPDAPHGVATVFDTGGIYVASQHPGYKRLLKGAAVGFGIA